MKTRRRDKLRIKNDLWLAMEIERTFSDEASDAIVKEVLSRPNISIIFAGCQRKHADDRPCHNAGYLAYFISRGSAVIVRLAVAADHRRLGVGSDLVRQLQDEAEKYGIRSVASFVNEDRLDVHTLFRGRGFACTGIYYEPIRVTAEQPQSTYSFTWPRPEPLNFVVIPAAFHNN